MLLMGCTVAGINFCFKWSELGELPKADLFVLQAMGLITLGYLLMYAIAILLIHVLPSKKEWYRQMRESLPHRKPR